MKTSVSQFTDDINDEFLKIRNNLQMHLDDDIGVQRKKMFLSRHVPKEVILSSEILLDTVINALMDDARHQLKTASAELQNKFYDYAFREKVKEWAVQIENKLSLEPEYVKYSSDPQLVNGLVAAGITFVVGAAITGIAFIPTMVIGAIVSGIVTLILSAVAFKFAYDKAEPKAISKMIEDIEAYLENSKTQVLEWLGKVILSFDNEFKSFCGNNGWEVK
ncbi:MAG TPA: hypothetical protein PKD03_12615 [Ignavibacteriaceae bacterium]|nr:hypothetical protein [Ignavibacteriaceae bacterium]